MSVIKDERPDQHDARRVTEPPGEQGVRVAAPVDGDRVETADADDGADHRADKCAKDHENECQFDMPRCV